MSNLLQAGGQIERTLGRSVASERVAGPAAGSVALHVAIGCTIAFYGLINGLFHHNTWGGAPGGGAIQVQITSAIPLRAERNADAAIDGADDRARADSDLRFTIWYAVSVVCGWNHAEARVDIESAG